MKKIILVIIVFCSFETFCQTNKNVFGTFAIGCNVFNYEFCMSPNGLCRFKVDYVEGEENIIYFDNDSINEIIKNLTIIKDSLDILVPRIEPQKVLTISKHDSILTLLLKYQNLLAKIQSNSADKFFWKTNKDLILSLIKYTDVLKLNRYDSSLSLYARKPRLKTFNDKLEKTVYIADNSESKTYTLNEFKQETFVPVCRHILTNKKSLSLPECIGDTNINNLAISIFYQIQTKLEFQDDEPITAYLKLRSPTINCYYSKRQYIRFSASDNSKVENKFNVENVSIEFEDGCIKNIFADLSLIYYSRKKEIKIPIRFKNSIPISISNKNDKENFRNNNIYFSTCGSRRQLGALRYYNKDIIPNKYLIVSASQSNNLPTDTFEFKKMYFVLSDLIDYVDILETNKEDYSPANCVVNLNQNNTVVELKKEKRSRILTAKAFTDLVGIQDDQPNGLIQIEASRKFNLNTIYRGKQGGNICWLAFIEPKLTFSKIEENNSKLMLNTSDLFIYNHSETFKIQPIDLLKYQSSSFNIDLNLLKIHFLNYKSNFKPNFSLGFLRTNVTDSIDIITSTIHTDSIDIVSFTAIKSQIPNDRIINSYQWGFSFQYELKPDSRYGLKIGYDMLFISLLNDKLFFKGNYDIARANTFWLEANLKTDNENMLFFRYKFSYVSPAFEQNYVQIQMGYLINLFKTRS